MADRADDIEIEKRIHQVGLMLPRKPKKIIVQFISQTWGITSRQAYNYIRLARKEWNKYFTELERCGKAYYFAKFRHIYDKVLANDDFRLALDVTKEEAKLMGIYPAEKHKVDLPKVIKVKVDLTE